MASGTRARNASAAVSTGWPANGEVRILPPTRSVASRTTTWLSGRSSRSVSAVVSPVMPAPTTTTDGWSVVIDAGASEHPFGQGRHHRRVGVERPRAGEGETVLGGATGRFDVEVVE